jgi:hypothetical protein
MTREEVTTAIWGDIVLRGIPRISREDVSEWVEYVEKHLTR